MRCVSGLTLYSGSMGVHMQVCLKDGSQAHSSVVKEVLASARVLREENFVLFYEFVTKCRFDEHIFHGELVCRLQELELVQMDGRAGEDVRHVIRSALIDSDDNYRLSLPYAVIS